MSKIPVIEHPLFLLDYDGTLAEIVDEPDRAFPHAEVPNLLNALHQQFPLYILTGRNLTDLSKLLGVTGLNGVGVHGLEEGKLGEQPEALIEPAELDALDAIRQALPDIQGLKIEDKRLSLALHYRNVKPEGLATLQHWAKNVPANLDRLWGKKVLELRPHGYSKGRAATRLANIHSHATPVALGDDTTDEEMFAALPTALTIKVGEGQSVARMRLSGVVDVVSYLKRYLTL
jgi:trehalose 6-phosphate phosphatase